MNNRKGKGLPILIAFMLIILDACPLFAAEDWETNLTVNISAADNRLSFGQRHDATDGIDGKYDVPAMLGGDIKAYFRYNEGNYWRDIKSTDGARTWAVRVESALKDKTVILKWKQKGLPDSGTIIIKDTNTGTATDMRQNNSYSYQNDEGVREFTIEVTP